MMTAQDLATWWHSRYDAPGNLISTVDRLKKLRDRGYTSQDIQEKWEEWLSERHPPNIWEPQYIDDLFPQEAPPPPPQKPQPKPVNQPVTGNLLVEEKYLHPVLMKSAPPVRSRMDEDGNVHHIVVEWIPGRIEKFTMDDLINYYYRKFPSSRPNEKRDMKSMEYLLKLYGVDKLLFIIDAASLYNHYEDQRTLKSPVELTQYEDAGIDAYNEKMNY